jgi:hypothetical protein
MSVKAELQRIVKGHNGYDEGGVPSGAIPLPAAVPGGEPSFAQLKLDMRLLDRQSLVDLVVELAATPTENFVETSPLEVVHSSVVTRATNAKKTAARSWSGGGASSPQLAMAMFKGGVLLDEEVVQPPMSPSGLKAAEILCGLSPRLPPELAGMEPMPAGMRHSPSTDGLLYFAALAGSKQRGTSHLGGNGRLGQRAASRGWGGEDEATGGGYARSPRKHWRDLEGSAEEGAAKERKTQANGHSKAMSQRVRASNGSGDSTKPHPGACNHCGETESPQWRKGPQDKPHLCNACGTRFLRTGSLQHSSHRRVRGSNDGGGKAHSGSGSDSKSSNSDGPASGAQNPGTRPSVAAQRRT